MGRGARLRAYARGYETGTKQATAEKDREIAQLTEAIADAETQAGFLISAIMADDPMVQLLFRAKDLHNVLIKALGKEE